MTDKKLNERDADLLRRCTVGTDRIILPEQLSRTDYESVNKVIVNLGGKWNRGAQAHLFKVDPRPLVEAALSVGKAIDKKKADQAFMTPYDLAERVVTLAQVAGHRVLEPSAGEGSLAQQCIYQKADDVCCIEIDADRCRKLESLGFEARCMDFTHMIPMRTWPRIVMNPPFTKNQDIRHVEHALQFLDETDGRLVAIMSPSVTRERFRQLLRKCPHYVIHEVAAGAFKESGTNIATIILEVWN